MQAEICFSIKYLQMITKKEIESFFEQKKFAIAGVSRNEKKFGGLIYKQMKEKGFDVIPINPNIDDINGDPCYKDVASIPAEYDKLLIITPSSKTESIVSQAVGKGINSIWIQQKSDTPQALEIARNNNINLIHGKCIFMFAEPVKSIHKFHRGLAKVFGKFPR